MLNDDITSSIVSPRGKRERIATHYNKALHGLVNYFDAPESVIEFIEAALIHHGHDEDEWTATGAELAAAIAPASTADQRARIRDRIAKQRQRLAKWQNTKDRAGLSRPVLVAIRAELREEGESKRWQYFYCLPIAGLVRQVIEKAPVGAGERRIKSAVKEVAKDYLSSTGLRRPSRVASRKHTPESQIKRGLAYLKHGLERAKASEIDASEIVKKALFENDNLLETVELLKQTVGIILTLPDEDFPTDEPNLAYSETLNIYAQTEDNGAAGRGVTSSVVLVNNESLIQDGSEIDQDQLEREEIHGIAPRCSTFPSSDPARDALRIFQSVGVGCFDESTLCAGRRDYVKAIPADVLLDQIADRMTIQDTGSPYILRPIQPAGVALIQLDDFDAGRVAELERIAFIIYQTSATKFQAWLAVQCDDATRDALRRSLIDHFRADRSASGATRWPGSLNQKYSPPYRVTIRYAALARVLRVADLPVTLPAPAPQRVSSDRPRIGRGILPDYQTELARAANANAADWSFSIKALSSSRGCTPEQVIEALMEQSPTAKARPRMIAYTVERARRVAR